MNIEVNAPSDHAGDVIGDPERPARAHRGDGARGRGRLGARPGPHVGDADLRVLAALDDGRPRGYSMEFSHYEEVPAHLAEKVVAAAKAEKEKAH
jgi:elongation factor G